MHTFVCIVDVPYRLILVCEHDIICVYVCLYKYTNKIDVLSTKRYTYLGSINVMVMVMVTYAHMHTICYYSANVDMLTPWYFQKLHLYSSALFLVPKHAVPALTNVIFYTRFSNAFSVLVTFLVILARLSGIIKANRPHDLV